MSKSRKHKREFEDLLASVKYDNIHHTKKQSLPGKELEHKMKKRMISKLIPYLHSCSTHLHGILAPK